MDEIETTKLCCQGFVIREEDEDSSVNSSELCIDTDVGESKANSIEGSVASTVYAMDKNTKLFKCTYKDLYNCR
eukprot:7342511-Ditylum_brightwellii.AAC.1